MFHRLMIANRGEVAVRIARACRELGVAPVGVASTADAGSAWCEAMDEVVVIGGGPAVDSYLRADRLVQAAVQTRCTALHPGWGFLAEHPRFAALCEEHGITFVGPSPAVMARMGLKSPAKEAMRAAGLPVVPGSDGPLADLDAARACAGEIGYPVLLKADAGGGGRGMRRCADEAELEAAFSSACAEAEAAFGNGDVYVEKFLSGGRHVEFQLLADAHGNAVHLGERDCSVQRNHQKLIEEAPGPTVTDELRERVGAQVARAAAAIGYRGAGTIEFLQSADGELYFMEMNTRLQVEHPVTELVTGVDVAVEQIRIAAHQPLELELGPLSGHAIECRINAEDPAAGFRPSPGRLEIFELARGEGPGTVRVDSHLSAGESVPPHYDSLIAKVIAHADTRELAIETMLNALRASRIEGVKSTLPLHVAVLESEAFREGSYDTTAIPGWEGGAPEGSRTTEAQGAS